MNRPEFLQGDEWTPEAVRAELEYLDKLRDRFNGLSNQIDHEEAIVECLESYDFPWADVVKGSRPDLTIGPIAVRGIPVAEIERKRNRLRTLRSHLTALEEQLDEQQQAVEQMLAEMPHTIVREMLKERFLYQKRWKDVATAMNGKYPKKKKFTEDSCKKRVQRYLKIDQEVKEGAKVSEGRA